MNKIFTQLLVVFVVLCCFTSCITIIKPESEKTIKIAQSKPDYTGLTVDKLKEMLLSDTTHYKFVIFWGPGCGPCIQHMYYTYQNVYNRVGDKDVKWYFVLDDTGGIKHSDKDFKRTVWSRFPKYNMYDTTAVYSDYENKLTNTANYIFNNDDFKINDRLGTPTNFIVSKDNKLKKTYRVYSNGEKRIRPTDLYEIQGKKLYEIDFNKLDTLYLNFPEDPQICTPDKCY